MLKTDNWVYKIILILCLVAIVGCLIASIQCLYNPDAELFMRIGGGLSILGLMTAFFYISYGYGKEAHMSFLLFNVFFTLSQLASVLTAGVETTGDIWLALLTSATALALSTVFVFAKDLGKKKSLSLCVAIIVFNAAFLVVGLLNRPMQSATGGDMFGTLLAIRNASQLLLSILLGVMTVAKYLDKKSRGTH